GCRRRNGDVLVPDVDGMYARQSGKGGGPVHVAVAHQDELRVDSLRKERFCEGFVEFWHGRDTLGWRPADGTPAAVAIIGIRHLPLAAPRKRYIRPARRRKGASSFFLAAQESASGRFCCKSRRRGWRGSAKPFLKEVPCIPIPACSGRSGGCDARRLEIAHSTSTLWSLQHSRNGGGWHDRRRPGDQLYEPAEILC